MNDMVKIDKQFWVCCLFSLVLICTNCKKDSVEVEKTEIELATEEFLAIMDYYYLWNYNMPDVNAKDFNSPESLLNALRNENPYDKWSFIITATEFKQYFEQGEVVDHGIGFKLDATEDVRVSYIYENTPLYAEGVRRGWKVLKINGQEPSTYATYYEMWGLDEEGVVTSFEFENPLGQIHTTSVTKTVYKVNTVIHTEIFDVAGKKVGYLVFDSFIETSAAELEEVFLEFKTEGVDEFVLDLRYNPGGDMDITKQLASLLTGSNTNNQVLVSYEHNPDRSSENHTEKFELQTNSLELDRLFVIASGSSASASEVIINGLEPYIPVIVIGDDTHGKPVGMYVFLNEEYDYAYVPICFELRNKDGNGEYYNGIQADAYVYDDVSVPWGSPNEDCLNEALYYIEHGSFSLKSVSKYDKTSLIEMPLPVGIKHLPAVIIKN